MCRSGASTENAKNIGEVNNSSGFHLLELHLPSAGYSIGLVVVIVGIAAMIYCCCRKRRQHSINQFQPPSVGHTLNPFFLQMPQISPLWHQSPYPQALMPPRVPRGIVQQLPGVPARNRGKSTKEQEDNGEEEGRIEEIPHDSLEEL